MHARFGAKTPYARTDPTCGETKMRVGLHLCLALWANGPRSDDAVVDDGRGERHLAVGHAAQFVKTGTERFLIGGPMGFDLQVTLHHAGRPLVWIEASFKGQLANDGAVLPVGDGVFRCRE